MQLISSLRIKRSSVFLYGSPLSVPLGFISSVIVFIEEVMLASVSRSTVAAAIIFAKAVIITVTASFVYKNALRGLFSGNFG